MGLCWGSGVVLGGDGGRCPRLAWGWEDARDGAGRGGKAGSRHR